MPSGRRIERPARLIVQETHLHNNMETDLHPFYRIILHRVVQKPAALQ